MPEEREGIRKGGRKIYRTIERRSGGSSGRRDTAGLAGGLFYAIFFIVKGLVLR